MHALSKAFCQDACLDSFFGLALCLSKLDKHVFEVSGIAKHSHERAFKCRQQGSIHNAQKGLIDYVTPGFVIQRGLRHQNSLP